MINANDDWGIIEAAYQNLGGNNDDAIDPSTLNDYDLRDAVDQTAYEITNAFFPEIAMLKAFARNGYLDNDQIWEGDRQRNRPRARGIRRRTLAGIPGRGRRRGLGRVAPTAPATGPHFFQDANEEGTTMLGKFFKKHKQDRLEGRAANIAQAQREQAARTIAATNAMLEQAARTRARA